jgi:beta-lactamase superfamily II metal-dependent hydrolase
MPGEMILKIWDVQHGACAMLTHRSMHGIEGRLAMIDSGHNHDTGWKPSTYIKHYLRRDVLDYLFVTNADLDHISDLNNLWREGIAVTTFVRNRSVSPEVMRVIKEVGGELTEDIERYLGLHASYIHPVYVPFDQNMGGITARAFWNSPPRFYDTNNLSTAVFFKYGAFKILFPGDLEEDGWLALLEQADFRAELAGTTVLVASHHGRENGYCDVLFNYCHPRAIVMSDKAIVHDTQCMTQTYRQRVIDHWPNGVSVNKTGKQRHVLTTRRDGWIEFQVNHLGGFDIYTECFG